MGDLIAQDVRKVFRVDGAEGQRIEALGELSLTVKEGEFLVLLGPSGCGKSTLLNIVAGFEDATSGRITLDEAPINGPGPDRGVVFQDYALFPWLTVRKNVEFGPRNRGISRAARRAASHELLELVGLLGFEDSFPRELSGGMRQRVAIARVLANDPKMLLMDEPFGALDALSRYEMQKHLLTVWSARRKTVLFVTHSVDEALFLGDRVAIMSSRPGRIVDVVNMDEPRPRDLASDSLNAARRTIFRILEQTTQQRHGRRGVDHDVDHTGEPRSYAH